MSDKEKILIADDSAMNRAILTEMLGDGYEILEAENGRQAVAILQSATDIDLLLLDIMMPEMDGFEVLAMMNKYHLTAATLCDAVRGPKPLEDASLWPPVVAAHEEVLAAIREL